MSSRGTQRRAGREGRRPRPPLSLAGVLAATLALAGAVPALAREDGTPLESPAGGAPVEATETGPAERLGVAGASVEEPSADEPPSTDGSTEPTAGGRGKITIRADRDRVNFGRRVTFEGRRQPALKGRPVALKYKRPGRSLETVARTKTDADGRYEVSDKPKRNGVYVVTSPRKSGDALRSRREEIEVRARIELGARRHQLRKRGVKVGGRLRPRGEGRRVVLERKSGKGWIRIASAKTDRSGTFKARWNSPALGGYRLRARFRGDESNVGKRKVLPGRVYVYRADEASYYGPGLFGNRTACGQVLRRDTVGVAHKSIRCGTKVRFHYRGTTRRIPVIDRGPFVSGRRWDLTEGARRKLGFPKGVDEIWANR